MSERTIGSVLNLQNRFLRSTDLQRDFGDPSALEGYWLTDFGANCLRTVATGLKADSARRSWRLTGDYGTGKSAFALFLSTAMSDVAKLPVRLRQKAVRTAPALEDSRYAPVLVIGSRQAIGASILEALQTTVSQVYPRGGAAPLLDDLRTLSQAAVFEDNRVVEMVERVARQLVKSGKAKGLLIILDEVGKFLEHAANNAAKFALQQFQMNSKLLAFTLTPNAALLKFQGSANLTVEQVLKRRSEFLTTHRLNLVSVRPEPGVVSIAVARINRRMLQLDECWQRWKPACSAGNTDLLVGLREEDGSLLLISPVKNAPHTLIAGATGSGKSVLMQNLVLSMAATNTPEQLRLTLIDPKMGVDYFAFETLPHLSEPIITTPDRAMVVLTGLVAEMNRRYEVLRANRVPNVMELRKKIGATEQPPILWIVHDEFAEWMMTDEYREGVSDIVSRLGVKARAAGIFLIFAAQRPDANVMPMQLRANLGNRLVLRVDGEGTSEIALGEKGAERLLGKGHLAARLEGEDGTITGQVPYVSPDRIAAMVHAIEQQWVGQRQ